MRRRTCARAGSDSAFQQHLRDLSDWTEPPVTFPTTVRAYGRLARGIGRNRRRRIVAGIALLVFGLPSLAAQAAAGADVLSLLLTGALATAGMLLILRSGPSSGPRTGPER